MKEKIKLCCKFIFLLLFYQTEALSQEGKQVIFSCLTTNNGLSQSSVGCILKDRYGFLWFGTEDGLNKYDGYKFKVFRNKPGNTKTIPYNNIKCLFEDKAGDLWIGTLGGVAKYNRSDDSFTSYGGGVIHSIFESSDGTIWMGAFDGFKVLDRKGQKIIPARFKNSQFSNIENLMTSCIYEDSHENLWIGTVNGLFIYNRKWGRIQDIQYNKNSDPKEEGWVTSIIEDKTGIFWVSAENGLNVFSYRNDTLLEQRNDFKIPERLTKRITSMCMTKDNTIWAGKENELVMFNPFKEVVLSFQKNPQDDQSLSVNSIRTLYLDNQDILWIGTYGGGVNKYDKNQFAFSRYRIHNSENPGLISSIITSFEEDITGNIWIGTDGGGLFLWKIRDNRFIPFYPGSKTNYFPSYTILTLKLSRSKEYLWVGTYDHGLIELNIKTKAIRFYNTGNKKLQNNSVYAILEDRTGKLWIGTNGGGISVINPANSEVENYKVQPKINSLNNNTVRALCEDSDGSIWIGTYGGVNIYNPFTKSFSYFTPGNSNINNIVYSIFKDSKDNIWVGDMGRGLHLFDRGIKKFTTFSEAQGLSNNIVNSIVEDVKGYLWVSTSKGISLLNPQSHTFKNYTREDGLQSNEFIRGAGYITKTGKILFGSIDGFNIFYPGDISKNSIISPVVITDFQLYNKSVPAERYNPFTKENSHAPTQIILSYDESVFSIEFAALSFTVPEKNQYAYMLEGFDKDWNHVGNERKATYTNLDPGEYTFRVIASNNDGVWDKKGAFLKIIITPPFWKTGYAYAFYFIITLCLFYYIYREIKARERLKNEIIYQKLTAEKIEELNELKLNFFTNISHELRTPLSLITDPLRKIINEEVSTTQVKVLSNLAFKNASRLSFLVNQLLDFRKFRGKYKLELRQINVIEPIKEICQAFEERARERGIDFNLSFNDSFKYAWIDIDKIDKILTNLISNAFKFTPNGGKIQVLVSTIIEKNEKRSLEIQVKDNGSGIPVTYKEKIFDLFFQVESTPRYDMESSGIGLSLTKELVLLHGGEIYEIGKEGEGSIFIVKLPAGEQVPANSESASSETEIRTEESLIHSEESKNKVAADRLDTPIILLIEDNVELREYIAREVFSQYHVEQASTGTEGFEKAITFIPDLIISDIMMPDGNGLELCEKLKDDEKTSHIPVILLTAKQTDDNKIEGYKKGADAYVSKPFNSALLNTQVENLLESRRKLRTLFSKVKNEHPAGAEVTDVDKEFLKKAEQAILDNLSNSQFDVEGFAEKLEMNRRQLSRKLKAITNQTPHEYIIMVRLKKATQLLVTGGLNIAEVGYRVGFSEPANFTRAFTKVYGKSPKKYLSEVLNQPR